MKQIGIFAWFGYALPLAERLRLIAQAGFEATSLWLEDDRHPDIPCRLDDAPSMARDRGLMVDNAHAPFDDCNRLWSEIQADRDGLLASYRQHLDFCRRHRIARMVLHLSKSPTPPPLHQGGLAAFTDLLHYAEDAGVVLAVENTRRPDYLDAVFEQCPSPYLGFCYDSSHDALYGRPPGSILQRWGHLLCTTHFSDNAGEQDDHWLPGEGSVDWELVGRHFPHQTYDGVCHLEVFPKQPAHLSAQEFVQAAYQRALQLAAYLSTPSSTA